MRVRVRVRVGAAWLALALPGALGAQAIGGTVVDEAGRPVAGAVVSLVGADGRRVGGRLVEADGRFVHPAPPGSWRVRAERVGSRPAVSASVVVAAGDTARVALVLTAAPRAAQRLDVVAVRAESRCRVRPREGELAATLWEDVRTALTAVQLAREARVLDFVLERTVRTFDLEQQRVVRTERAVLVDPPDFFRAEPPDTLVREGFVRRVARDAQTGTLTFAAPDARVLISEPFVETHCLRAIPASRERPGELGLAFEPTRGRRTSDVAGTLWVDAASRELRALDFRFVRLPAPFPDGSAGGTLAFARRADGLWYVSRWAIRTPVLAPSGTLRMAGVDLADDRTAPDVREVREEGGRVLVGDEIPRAHPDSAVLRGRLTDSTAAHEPLADAEMTLVRPGAPDVPAAVARTDADGRFRLAVAGDGRWALLARHPRLAVVGADLLGGTATLVRGREAETTLAVGGALSLRARLCGRDLQDVTGLVVGVVRSAQGGPDASLAPPAADVPVEVRWASGATAVVDGRRERLPAGRAEARTDARGHFALCGVPPMTELELRVRGIKRPVLGAVAARGLMVVERWLDDTRRPRITFTGP